MQIPRSERGSRTQQLKDALTTRNVAQALVTILVGCAFALATFLASAAASRWSDAVKEDIKWSAGLAEDVRYLFTEEAPFAFEYAATVARADALAAAAEGRPAPEQGAALLEAHTTRTIVEERRKDFQSLTDTLLSKRYWRQDHFDVESRLNDARADARSTVVADPAAVKASGDRYAVVALAVSLVPIVVAGAYLGWVHRSRRPNSGGAAVQREDDVALIPDPGRRGTGVAAGLAFAAWLLLVILPPLQIQRSLSEDEASAQASAGAVQVMRTVLVSNLAAGLEADLRRRADDFARRAEVRVDAYSVLPVDVTLGQAAIVDGERAMAGRYQSLAAATMPTVDPSPNISKQTVDELNADPDDWQRILTGQNDAAAAAEQAGKQDNAMTLAVVLAGITTTLTALAAANKKSRVVPVLAASALVAAVGSAAVGLR
jgi:hypothetical protein